jgi:hypothetical protein
MCQLHMHSLRLEGRFCQCSFLSLTSLLSFIPPLRSLPFFAVLRIGPKVSHILTEALPLSYIPSLQ